MYEGILSTVGNTPLVKLSRILQPADFNLYAKLEAFNPGGSIKDRTAFSILMNALDDGLIYPGSTVIESSSGNMGIGLAQACAYFGLNFICVVDPKTTALNLEILKAFGAKVDLVSTPDPVTGEFLQARLCRVGDLIHQTENSFWPDQYQNLYNPIAHHQTMHEIVEDLDGRVDYMFCATSTCGTIRGCAEYIRMNELRTRLYAVDAVGSVIFSDQKGKRLIPGHGASIRPKLFQPDLVDGCIHVTDVQCIIGCRLLVKEEAILAGGSSGAVLMAVESFRQRIPRNANCVVVLADRGERYLDTIYSDAWVAEHFGEVSQLMEEYLAEKQCA